jgi:hypothetical protein
MISLSVLVSLYWLGLPQLPARGAMVNTEYIINRDSKADFDRAQIKTFVSRKDVIAQLQWYGISSEEALARVDSLTDQEIAQIADKLDELSAQAGGDAAAAFWAMGGNYLFYAALIFAVIMTIITIALDEGPNKPTYREFKE